MLEMLHDLFVDGWSFEQAFEEVYELPCHMACDERQEAEQAWENWQREEECQP